MEVHFYRLFTLSLGYLVTYCHLSKNNLVSSLECKLSGSGLAGTGHTESGAHSRMCFDLNSYTLLYSWQNEQWVMSQSRKHHKQTLLQGVVSVRER